MTPLISVENLCMDFDGKRILDTISFELSEGEILGIIGRSGAGKTVLMQLMRGVEQPPTVVRLFITLQPAIPVITSTSPVKLANPAPNVADR